MVRLRRFFNNGPSPSGPHGFIERRDGRSALALGAANADLQMAAPLAVADASLRAAHCALSGCGRPREDPIHSPSQ